MNNKRFICHKTTKNEGTERKKKVTASLGVNQRVMREEGRRKEGEERKEGRRGSYRGQGLSALPWSVSSCRCGWHRRSQRASSLSGVEALSVRYTRTCLHNHCKNC